MTSWLAVIHDTHATAGHANNVLKSICRWLAANHEARNISAILHTGDFVNDATSAVEWGMVTASGFPVSGVPNIWCPGNHDPVYGGTRDHVNMDTALPPSGMSGLIDSLVPGSGANTAHMISLGGRQWLVIALEFDVPDAAVAWADGVLAAHASTPAIVITHSYMMQEGVLSDATKGQRYVYTGLPGGDNYGQQLWDKSFAARGNVAMVFCGHDIRFQWKYGTFAYLAQSRASSAMFPTCHAFLRNFQGFYPSQDGSPFITLLGIDEQQNKLYVRELSPPTLLDRWYPSLCTNLDLVKT